MKAESDGWAQLFAWSTEDTQGTHIMTSPGQHLFMGPVSKDGRALTSVHYRGLTNEFTKVLVAYSASRGVVNMCIEEQCQEIR